MINFIIPGLPPSKSNNYRSARGHFFKNSKVRDYEQVFRLSTLKVPKHTFGEKDRLAVEIDWYPPHLRSDIDGILKILLDQCQKNEIIPDDRHIDELTVTRREVNKLNPRTVITFYGKGMAPHKRNQKEDKFKPQETSNRGDTAETI